MPPPSPAVLKLLSEAKSDSDGGNKLADLIKESSVDDLVSAVSSSLLPDENDSGAPGAGFLRQCVRACLADTDLHQKRRRAMSHALLLLMRNPDLTRAVADDAVCVLYEALDDDSVTTRDLLALLRQCHVELVKNTGALNTRWFEVMGQIISVLHGRDGIPYDHMDSDKEIDADDGGLGPDIISGSEFRLRHLRSVCALRWCPAHAATLCGLVRMLADNARLTDREFSVVSEKLCSEMKRLRPQEIPPLAHQMLLLCRNYECTRLLSALASYFQEKVGVVSDVDEEDEEAANQSQMESSDMIDSASVAHERGLSLQSECTVMLHLTQAVRMGHPVYKDILKQIRTSVVIPELLLLDHFKLLTSFSLTSVPTHTRVVVDGIRAALARAESECTRRKRDAWLRRAAPLTIESATPLAMIKALIRQTNRYQGWDLIGKGVLDLAFSLLDTSAGLGGKATEKVRAAWRLGADILLSTLRHSSGSLKSVISGLSSRIKSSGAAYQYSVCLRRVIRHCLPVVMEHPTLLTGLVEKMACSVSSTDASRCLTAALMPAVRANRSLRDCAILALRKALFDRSQEAKQVGLEGVMHMLRVFKRPNSLPLTQLLSQSAGGLSQLAADVYRGGSSFGSEAAICGDLIGVLRRALSTKQAGVRLTLYMRLADVAARNPELCLDFVGLMFDHATELGLLKKRPEEEQDIAVAIVDLDRMMGEQDGITVIMEPLGWFFLCVQQLLSRCDQMHGDRNDDNDEDDFDRDGQAHSVALAEMLDRLSARFSDADAVELGLEKNCDFSRATPAGAVNHAKAELLKNCMEALMERCVARGAADVRPEEATRLTGLFKRHSEVSAMMMSKGEKGKKKKDGNVGSQQPSQQNKKEKVAQAAPQFKMPEHAITIQALTVILKALLLDITPERREALGPLLDQTPCFVSYLLRVLSAKVAWTETILEASGTDLEANKTAASGSEAAGILRHYQSLAGILGQYIFKTERVATEREFRHKVASGEILAHLFELMGRQFPGRVEQFVSDVVSSVGPGGDATEGLPNLCNQCFSQISSLQDQGEDESKDSVNKVVAILLRILLFAVRQADAAAEEGKDLLSKVTDWCRRYGENCCPPFPEVVTPYLELLFTCHRAVTTDSNLPLEMAKELHSKLGDLDESVELNPLNAFAFISKDTESSVLQALVANVKFTLDSVEIVIAKCKLQASSSNNVVEDLAVSEAEVSIVLARLVNTLNVLSQSGFSLKSLLDQLLRALTDLYSVLVTLTKYFLLKVKTNGPECIRSAKFDKLVDLVGGGLTKKVYELINHIQRLHESLTNNSGRGSSSLIRMRVQKEARAIPGLIFKVEQFECDVIQLGSRCKTDLMQKTKISLARDFRIKAVQQVQQEDGEDKENEDDASTSAAPSEAGDITQNSVLQNLLSQDEEDEEETPPSKKLKVKLPFKSAKSAT